MAELEPGAKVAKDLGIYLGQIYGYVKRGLVKNHKEGGYPDGKGLIVDPDEVRAAWQGSRKKTRGPKPHATKTPRKVTNADGEIVRVERNRRLSPGTIVSYETGHAATDHVARPRYNIAQVLGSTGQLTYLDDGNHRIHYNGMQIDNLVYFSDRLSLMLARGVAHIERPHHVLGMIILAFVMEDKLELAESLENWMIREGLEVVVPEIMDLPSDMDADEPILSDDED